MADREVMRAIASRIRALRTLHDVTQAELAQAVGVSRGSIANIEMANQVIQLDALMAIARHLHTTVAALLGEGDLEVLPRIYVEQRCTVTCEQCGPVADGVSSQDAYEARKQHVRHHLGVTPVREV